MATKKPASPKKPSGKLVDVAYHLAMDDDPDDRLVPENGKLVPYDPKKHGPKKG